MCGGVDEVLLGFGENRVEPVRSPATCDAGSAG